MKPAVYLVSTPIGNLEDITFRAVRTLREVDAIACEDTRHTLKLLRHFDVRKPLVSYHEHNEAERAAELIERVKAGEAIAVVSDAGAPGVSDPGFRVVRAAIDAGVEVVPIPGPSALVAALTASGLPTDAFRFCGFPPSKSGQRKRFYEELAAETATLVFYESPHRALASVEDARDVLGDRPAVLARELTKLHEEFLRGTLSDVAARLAERGAIKGEMTLVIGRGEGVERAPELSLADRVAALIDSGSGRMDAIKQAARERGLSKRDAYRQLEEETRA